MERPTFPPEFSARRAAPTADPRLADLPRMAADLERFVPACAALERGFTHSRTSSHSINAPMLAINEKLGFVRETAVLTVQKVLSPG